MEQDRAGCWVGSRLEAAGAREEPGAAQGRDAWSLEQGAAGGSGDVLGLGCV